MAKVTDLPDGFGIETPEWHFDKFVEFTEIKGHIGEPSPHLAIVGWISKDYEVEETVWLLGCYGATYSLPTAQVIYDFWSYEDVLSENDDFFTWLEDNWKGIVTRTERRCVRTPEKMHKCLTDYANWTVRHFPTLPDIQADSKNEYYDKVFDNMAKNVKFFGRYIIIRVVEGLKRYCDIPAELYDVRSVGGWSPKKCMMYLEPDHVNMLCQDTAEANAVMDRLVEELIVDVKEVADPTVRIDSYVIAAMLCEYRGAYENRHQYPGWTIDQEPLLYDKVKAYWGDDLDSDILWEARKALFPEAVLGEVGNRWYGTRWDVAKVLRDYGYNWDDRVYDYVKSTKRKSLKEPEVLS